MSPLQGLAERFVPYKELELVWNQVKDGQAAYLHNKQFLEFVIATQFTSSKGESSMRIMKVSLFSTSYPHLLLFKGQRTSELDCVPVQVPVSLVEQVWLQGWLP